jgi:hypothetical protein
VQRGDIKMDDVLINENRVREAVLMTKKNKSAGVDDINSDMLLENLEGVVKPLTILFQKSLESCTLPNVWKKANICPIFKKGSKLDPGNYRPVSLTCQAGKICEKIIKEDLVQYLEKNTLISGSQHGFRKGHSCLSNVLDFVETARFR